MACSVPFHAAQKTSAALKGKSHGEFQLVPFIVGQVDDHGSSSRQVNSGASLSGSQRIG